MAKFKCINTNCPLFNEEINVIKYSWKTIDKKSVYNVYCEHCKEHLEYIEQPTGGRISANYNAFSAKSNQQKKEAIRKRAMRHYKKHGENVVERKRAEIKKEIVKKMLGNGNK